MLVTVLATACGGTVAAPPVGQPDRIAPLLHTDPVTHDADDPAIWVHPTDPARSLIVGTNKVAAPDGALVVFGVDGRTRQVIAGLDRPNNVDIQTGVRLGRETVDVVVTTERLRHQLRVYTIRPDGSGLAELGVVPVLEGETGDRAEPMGIGLYLRPADGALFAIVAPKLGGTTNYLAQYRLELTPGGPTGVLVRRFGHFSAKGPQPGEPGEIEALVVDDALGYVYYADERYGIHKWSADPDAAGAAAELALFGTDGYQLDREGLALYTKPDGTGYLISTDQVKGGSTFKVYRREGEPGHPHLHRVIADARTTADDTDGIEVTSAPLPNLPDGVLVAMNSRTRTFAIFDWRRLFPALR